MDKGKKIAITIITIIILVILVVLITIVWKTKTESDNVVANDVEENILNEEDSINETDGNLIEEDSENETQEENIVTDTENSNIAQSNVAETTQNEYIGKEEEESNLENNGENEEEKVINLAKEAWGISPDSYTFAIDSKQGDIYTVSVSANATVIAYYEINPKTGEVIEK